MRHRCIRWSSALALALLACGPSIPEVRTSPGPLPAVAERRAATATAPRPVLETPLPAPAAVTGGAGTEDLVDLAQHIEPRPTHVLVIGLQDGSTVSRLRAAGFGVDVVEADRETITHARASGFVGPVAHMDLEVFALDRGLRRQDYRDFERPRSVLSAQTTSEGPLPARGYGLVIVNDASWGAEAQEPQTLLRPLRWTFLGDQVGKPPVVASRDDSTPGLGMPFVRGRRMGFEAAGRASMYRVNVGVRALRTAAFGAWPEERNIVTRERKPDGVRRVLAAGILSSGALRLPDAYGDGGAIGRFDVALAPGNESGTTPATALSTEGTWGGKRAEPPAGALTIIEADATVEVSATLTQAPSYKFSKTQVQKTFSAPEWRGITQAYETELDAARAALQGNNAGRAEAAIERAAQVFAQRLGEFAPMVESYRFVSGLLVSLRRAQTAGLGLHAAPLLRMYGPLALPERTQPWASERVLADTLCHFALRELEHVLTHDKSADRLAAAQEVVRMDPPSAKGAYEQLIKLRARATATLEGGNN